VSASLESSLAEVLSQIPDGAKLVRMATRKATKMKAEPYTSMALHMRAAVVL
jgi:hypothetical protein